MHSMSTMRCCMRFFSHNIDHIVYNNNINWHFQLQRGISHARSAFQRWQRHPGGQYLLLLNYTIYVRRMYRKCERIGNYETIIRKLETLGRCTIHSIVTIVSLQQLIQCESFETRLNVSISHIRNYQCRRRCSGCAWFYCSNSMHIAHMHDDHSLRCIKGNKIANCG